MGRKLQCQTQQRDGLQPATSELPGCPSAWTTGRIQGKFHFIPTSFNSFIHLVICSYCPSSFRGGFIIWLHEYAFTLPLLLLTCLPCSQENSVDIQKSTSTVGSPNTTKTNPPKKKSCGWMTGRIKGCSVCCAYWPACLSPKRTPSIVRNSPPHFVCQTPQKQTHPKNLCLCVVSTLPLLLPQKQTHPKKNSPAGWRDGLRVALCVVSALPLLLPQKQTHSKNLCLSVLCVCYHCCCHKNKPTQKKDGPSRWRDGFRVVVNRRVKGCCK